MSKIFESMPTVVDFAHQVINLDMRVRELEHENHILRGYQQQYFDLLNSSIKHNDVMIGNVLALCLTKDITPKQSAR